MARQNSQKPTRTAPSKNPFKPKAAMLAVLLLGSIGGYGGATYLQTLRVTADAVSTTIQVRFSPGGQCMQFIEETLAKAQDTILVQAYSFTSSIIANALIAAYERGVAVQILVDRSQLTARSSKVHRVVAKGIPVLIDVVPGIAHNKVMLIDDDHVLTGSFNWTDAAEKRNAENLLLIKDRNISKIYRENWDKRAAKAQAAPTPTHPVIVH